MADFCADTLIRLLGNDFRSANSRVSFASNASDVADIFTSVYTTTSITLGNNLTSVGGVGSSAGEEHESRSDPTMEMIKFYLAHVINPFFCAFGLLGNVFSVIVLSRRRFKAAMDCTMEQAAHTGLIALAVSDELYCACALMDALVGRSHSVFASRDLSFYVRVYGKYMQNTFARTGTWLTVIMAAGRYAAICRPIQARYLLGVNCTRIAVAVTFVFWTVIGLPMIWSYQAFDYPCPPDHVIVVLDLGQFVVAYDGMLKLGFMYVWATLGFFLPVILLVYFNFHLITALRESSRMRSLYRVSSKVTSAGSRVTPTLVAIVCLLLALVTPSELLQFYYYAVRKEKVESFNMVIVFTNVLQTLNFSVNFVMYCIVNVHFRETWKELMYCKVCRGGGAGASRPRSFSRSSPPLRNRGSMKTPSTIETAI